MSKEVKREERAPAVAERSRESRDGAVIKFEKLTISKPVREAIERELRVSKSKVAAG